MQTVKPRQPADLREDAGGGGDSAVHHAVEHGEQAVQGERLGPQEVVTCLHDIKIRFSYPKTRD